MADGAWSGSPLRRALIAAGIYAAAASLWLVVSDELVRRTIDDPALQSLARTLKGFLFLAVTTGVLLILLWSHARIQGKPLAAASQPQTATESVNHFQQGIIESPQVWINTLNLNTEITLWNQAAEQISGYPREDVLGHARIWEWLYPDPDYRDWMADKTASILDDGVPAVRLETRIRTRSGEERDLEWYLQQLHDDDDNVIGAVAFGVDITRMGPAQRALHERPREVATLMANLPGMAYRCRDDNARTMVFVSDGCEALTGYTAAELHGPNALSFAELVIDTPQREAEATRREAVPGNSFAYEYRIRRRDGGEAWVLERGSVVTLAQERFREGIVLDITERKRMEEELQHLASHDQLTGLYNRRTMDRLMRDELARAERYDRPLSVLWLDLDHFKRINDEYGHDAGDAILQQAAACLSDNLRTTDYLARYGGEELLVAMPEAPLDEALQAAERLRKAVEQTDCCDPAQHPLELTVSVGVASYPDHGRALDQLYRAADNAMYWSKEAGRNTVGYLEPGQAQASAAPGQP